MATITTDFTVAADPDLVWDAVRDVGALHTRLVPGFVTAVALANAERVVTFANGMTITERIVTVDDRGRRLVYAASGGRTTHHNASLQVLPAGPGRARLIWITDLLPEAVAPQVRQMVDQAVAVMTATLERRP